MLRIAGSHKTKKHRIFRTWNNAIALPTAGMEASSTTRASHVDCKDSLKCWIAPTHANVATITRLKGTRNNRKHRVRIVNLGTNTEKYWYGSYFSGPAQCRCNAVCRVCRWADKSCAMAIKGCRRFASASSTICVGSNQFHTLNQQVVTHIATRRYRAVGVGPYEHGTLQQKCSQMQHSRLKSA